MIKAKIESILYIAGRPLSIKELSSLLQTSKQEIEKALQELEETLKERESGLRVLRIGGEVQLATTPTASREVEQFLQEEIEGELTRPALETLTILAYRGPMKKTELEHIRGVNCSLILRNLLLKSLVTKEGTEEDEIYMASFEFLKMLQISEFRELPDYEKLNERLNQNLPQEAS